jgi:hypothetical protein
MYKLFRDTKTFCTFEKIHEPTTANKRSLEQAVFKRKEIVKVNTGSQLKNRY